VSEHVWVGDDLGCGVYRLFGPLEQSLIPALPMGNGG
jgi:hypothetical protein